MLLAVRWLSTTWFGAGKMELSSTVLPVVELPLLGFAGDEFRMTFSSCRGKAGGWGN
jgi:hypothetical protein